ncbi:MAG: glycogen/starch/alpha-glucan phosphorylase [Gemmiger formicilis]|uniref:glycogen/starch/alpha-glucan phosphorylase n=1 Tax=Gemmiger formicilis TaxID=745368 RepID=UPI00399328F3
MPPVRPVTGRKLYYISAEFLIGKLLSNNLINLGLYDDTRAALAAAGKNLSDIEEVEARPSGNGDRLGRLAACFHDSLATLNLPGDGVGLRYHFGLYQSFKNGVRMAARPVADRPLLGGKNRYGLSVELAGKTYNARRCTSWPSQAEGRTNTLNLFDLDTIDESIVHDSITFDKTDIDKNLTLSCIPMTPEAGRRLRSTNEYNDGFRREPS